ncbi:Crp/Fnr family transcriptional regulator [Flavobacterium polysaccharolyticum]|uniref:Crp/Fnr family transcriptional regulator n=1 Tax=Flavobacterium polysaccharolyticum TaxID=3133148 RepID=A0ABU9NSY7_9FLAO
MGSYPKTAKKSIQKDRIIEQQEKLFRHFENYIKLNDGLKAALSNKISFVSFKKGEIIHHADKICTKSYFIQKGLFRIYFIKDGKEISEYFPAEGEWSNSPRSFRTRAIDIYYIDAIEDTEALCLDVDDLMFLFESFPEMERYARLSMGTVFGHFMERITSMRFTTAKEKYNHFIKTYHDIHHRIPLGMIASYLGITQETLSRIRAEK